MRLNEAHPIMLAETACTLAAASASVTQTTVASSS